MRNHPHLTLTSPRVPRTTSACLSWQRAALQQQVNWCAWKILLLNTLCSTCSSPRPHEFLALNLVIPGQWCAGVDWKYRGSLCRNREKGQWLRSGGGRTLKAAVFAPHSHTRALPSILLNSVAPWGLALLRKSLLGLGGHHMIGTEAPGT